MQSSYTLNESFEVVDVHGDWDTFARETGAWSAQAEFILGRSVFDFMEGEKCKRYYSSLFCASIDQGSVTSHFYRCDDLAVSRLYSMQLRGLGKGLIATHALLQQIKFPDEVRRSKKLVTSQCSICCKYFVNGVWKDQLSLPSRRLIPSKHTVCPDCLAKASQRMPQLCEAARIGGQMFSVSPFLR